MLGSVRCAACGSDSPAGFRFCGNCGAVLEEAVPAREVRKVVSIVFCDLTGSTALGDVTDPEALRATMRGYYEEMRTILERHGGTVEKFVGDAVMAVFGVPVSHEDDALRAVRAAWEMRAAVPALGLRARIGVNTGEVVAGEGDSLVTGDAVNVAARLEQAAEPGEVLIGAETRRLVRDAVKVEPLEVTAKGKPEPVGAFRLVDVDPEAEAIARRLDTPLIGRGAELEQLRKAFERTGREQRCHLFTLLGPAGVGKSRLVAEVLDGLDATVLHGRCLDYGEGITFWPVISVLKQLGERADGTVNRIVEGASSPNELFWAVRSQLEEVALERPLVVCFDDIQWGEQTFLDLVDHIADLSRGAPILLLCVARPELLDKRPEWGGGKLNATMLLLAPLSGSECTELIEAHGGVDEELRGRILAAADGNPLFVEEMVALAHEGGDVRVPSSVQALLQARLDQLDRAERQVMERGSVEGQIFHRKAVLELTQSTDVEPQLVGLVRKELIYPAPTTFSGDHAFQFRHLLIRDAAYDGLPKETRANLHEQFAAWLDANGAELIELDEVLGYHLEQAAHYRRELGRQDVELELAAGRRLASAGSRAALRSDAPGAANLLGRAIALLPDDDPTCVSALVGRVAMLEQSGDRDAYSRAIDALENASDANLRMHGRIARLQFRLMIEPAAVVDEAERTTEEAFGQFTEAHDDLGLAQTYYLLSWTSWLRSKAVPSGAAQQKVVEYATRAGAPLLADRTRIQRQGVLTHGPFTPAEIRPDIEAFRKADTPIARISVLMLESNLDAREGRFAEAIEKVDDAMAIFAELGLSLGRAITTTVRAEVLAAAGRFTESEDAFRATIAMMEELGQTSFRSTVLIELAAVLFRLDRPDEAERHAIEGEELGAVEDVVNFAWGRGVRAKIAADRGEHEEAERLAEDSIRFAYETDFPVAHAEAHEARAHVLQAAGRPDESRAELERALELWGRYGYAVEAARVRELLVEL
jgi:class 3 adenylate cyclase/tetratricopeptide (TPR) repeat protein